MILDGFPDQQVLGPIFWPARPLQTEKQHGFKRCETRTGPTRVIAIEIDIIIATITIMIKYIVTIMK
jgi:hypothetical protein